VSTETSPKANPVAVFHSLWYRLALLFYAVFLVGLWSILGPSSPFYAVTLLWFTCSLVAAVPESVMRLVPNQWLRVPAGERVLHRILGVGIFGWLLDVSGWNRNVPEPIRAFSGKRAGLAALEQWARVGAISHGICFAIHALLAVLALFTRHPLSGALGMLLPGVVVHLYPVLVQRALLLRLQPLLDKTGSR
jgi:hypothetical protein